MAFIRPSLTLFVLASVCAVILAFIYDITREPIRLQQIAQETAMVAELLPGTVETLEEYVDNHAVTKVVQGFNDQGDLLGYVITASAPGYSGPVVIMAGFNAGGTLTAVQVLSHRETPGLGTAILAPSFLEQFEGRTEPMTVVRMATSDNEIQALASATISTAAVVNGINAAMSYVATYIME